MFGKKKFDYEIEQVNSTDYTAKIIYKAKKMYFQSLFKMAKKKMQRKVGGGAGLELQEEWAMPPENKDWIFKVIKKPLSRDVKTIMDLAKIDGFIMVNWDLDEMAWKKIDEKTWNIIIDIKGSFVLKNV